jgi:hypothetical protein
MIYYNVSIHIEPAIEQAWLQWMLEIHIPQVMATGCFTDYVFTRLLEPVQEGTLTYIAQYLVEDESHLQQYYDEYAPALRQDSSNRFGDNFVIFRSVTKSV